MSEMPVESKVVDQLTTDLLKGLPTVEVARSVFDNLTDPERRELAKGSDVDHRGLAYSRTLAMAAAIRSDLDQGKMRRIHLGGDRFTNADEASEVEWQEHMRFILLKMRQM